MTYATVSTASQTFDEFKSVLGEDIQRQRMPENNPSSSGDEVRQVLERVLTTANLYSSKRNQELLRYLIDGAASGRSASFKEF